MKAPKFITSHANFNSDDYAYLSAKGWSNTEIKARWDAERAEGCSPCRWETYAAKAKLASVKRVGY